VVRLERFRWWHVEPVLAVERVLFQPEPWTAHHFWSELGQTATRHYVVALEGLAGTDELAGYAGLCSYPDEAFVQTMAVAPAYQGKGLGGVLLTELLEEAARRGQRRTLLEVRADNDPAQRLYLRHGFRKIGVRRGYYAGGPGGVDAWVMERAT
jgi:ribosomal-protein-alanine N-acetyltransferase